MLCYSLLFIGSFLHVGWGIVFMSYDVLCTCTFDKDEDSLDAGCHGLLDRVDIIKVEMDPIIHIGKTGGGGEGAK